MLFSTALEFSSLRFAEGHDLAHVLFLPTYAATAWYHGKIDPSLRKRPLRVVLDEVEAFAASEYALALFQGDQLSAAKYAAIAAKLARYTGLSAEYLASTHLRVQIHRFCKELLRAERRTVGRLDSRFKGMDRDSAGEHFEADPAHTNLDGAFAACINDYLGRTLEFTTDTPYTMISKLYTSWDFGAQNQYLNVAEPLRKAMSANPHMKVYVAFGYYDLATPHFASDYVLNHMALDASLAGNIEKHYYEAGHMMYAHYDSLKAQGRHLKDFIRRCL
jgi:carboxypeptidase C (cathepsin A)